MIRITLALAVALIMPAAFLSAQDAAAPPKPPASDIFSGIVIALSPEAVTVERTALLRDTVKRTFIRDSQTVVEGTLKPKARVSVRYTTDESGQFHALHIIVR